MSSVKSVGVVVVTYNSEATISDCIMSLGKINGATHITVVDNGSTDKTLEIVRAIGSVQVLSGHGNIGFGAAVNQGVRHTIGEIVLVLNPDAYVEDGINDVVDYARKHACIVTGLMRGSDGLSRPNVFRYPNFGTVLRVSRASVAIEELSHRLARSSDNAVAVDYVEGSLLVMRRPVWEDIGGFSSSYYMYGEDRDISYRANRIGIETVLLGVVAFSHEGGFGPSRQKWYVIGILTFFSENRPERLFAVYLLLWSKFIAKYLSAVGRGQKYESEAFMAVLMELRNWMASRYRMR